MIHGSIRVRGRHGKHNQDGQNNRRKVHGPGNGQENIQAIDKDGKGSRKRLSHGQEGKEVFLVRHAKALFRQGEWSFKCPFFSYLLFREDKRRKEAKRGRLRDSCGWVFQAKISSERLACSHGAPRKSFSEPTRLISPPSRVSAPCFSHLSPNLIV